VEILKVSSKSNPNSVAGAMAGVVRQAGAVEVQVVGAGALNQAIKALAIARGYVSSSGIDLVCLPTFADIEIDGQDRTGIHLLIESRVRVDGRIVDGTIPAAAPEQVAGPGSFAGNGSALPAGNPLPA
jgi:stage V sporulation protein S